MGKFIKQGKVVIVLNGRFAGRKAVVLKTYDEGHGARKFGHALIAGIDRAPRRLKRKLSDKKKVRSRLRQGARHRRGFSCARCVDGAAAVCDA